MSQTSDKLPSRPGRWTALFKDRHFLVAATILLAAGCGFNAIILGLGVWLAKSPVPPPAFANFDDQRLVNFPERLGQDGSRAHYILSGTPAKISKETVEELGTRQHPMNWYYSAVFHDPKARMALQLDLTYYTGLLDAVPHVPTNCIVAGGGTVINDQSGSVSMAIPSVGQPWDKITIQRTAWMARDKNGVEHRYFQYYLFSLNGRPSDSRYEVRKVLMHPLKKYCYFAKIQIAPLVADLTAKENDDICRDFLMYALPDILKYLPSEQDIRQLEAGSKAGAQ